MRRDRSEGRERQIIRKSKNRYLRYCNASVYLTSYVYTRYTVIVHVSSFVELPAFENLISLVCYNEETNDKDSHHTSSPNTTITHKDIIIHI